MLHNLLAPETGPELTGRIATSPHWEWWIIFYFFLGGIASGAYFIGTLIDLFGTERDRPIAKMAFYIAFPLVAICGVLLIADLGRPERFWHMLIQSNTFLPMFKYWSPMSVGSWGLMLFSFFSAGSFVGALAEDGRFGLGRFSSLARYLHEGPVGMLFQLGGTLSGFFLASYTGVLLSATNQPFWSDSNFIGGMFLASAASTGIATLIILLWGRRVSHASITDLERTDRWAMLLELGMMIAFFISLGGLAPILLASPYGLLIIFGTALLGILIPLFLQWRPQTFGRTTPLVGSALALIGGFILRYAVVMAGQHVTVAGR